MENYMICNCKKVSFFDVENALHEHLDFASVQKAFEHVQEVTHCSTGCGGCYEKILDAISEIMHK
ncbi:MAG: (2Fe-2S)-binding protein [Clostridia bacterium]|nr:(2Fe-2S)-binding protein [Clostridia bacterium]